MTFRWLFPCALILLLSACGGRTQTPVIENPYASQVQELSGNGVLAMQRERWVAAEHTFVRALQAAQLTADPTLIAHAWYNLAMAYVAQKRLREADEALQQAETLARRHRLSVEYARVRLNRALLAAREGRKTMQPDAYARSMPLDVHLAAARLADLQERREMAGTEYRLVLALADKTRADLHYGAEAHLGLALLAMQTGDITALREHSERALNICRRIGAPRLAAHALLLLGRAAEAPEVRQDHLERARSIYHALGDVAGERKALTALLAMATEAGNGEAEKALHKALNSLPEKVSP